MVPFFDLGRLEGPAATPLARQYRLAKPFPHIVLEDFVLTDIDELLREFPDEAWEGWTNQSNANQPSKSSCPNINVMPPLLKQMINELFEPPFLRAMSNLMGIQNLLPDPFLNGGGLHVTAPGGRLTPHTDYHHHPKLRLFRRANILIYLNGDWKSGDGGELCLFNLGDDRPVLSIPPRYGTCVIFTTDHRSLHGVNPISETAGIRRSIALYYYTIEDAEIFSGDGRTFWYERTDNASQTMTEKARVFVMKSALGASKVLARIAYRFDPQHPIQIGEIRNPDWKPWESRPGAGE